MPSTWQTAFATSDAIPKKRVFTKGNLCCTRARLQRVSSKHGASERHRSLDALQQQLFQFLEPTLEQMQRALDRRRCTHVHACRPQSLQRKLGAARAQKIQIRIYVSWLAGEHAL